MTRTANIDSRQFRDALGSFTTGITIVTTRTAAGADVGVTANSFNSVSLTPPMVLWSLAKSSLSRPAFVEAKYFAVHVLAVTQEALANKFAQRGIEKFADLSVGRGPGDIPLLDGCSARFQCQTTYRYEGGDHEIIVGQVVAFDSYDLQPLAFHKGRYGSVLTKDTAPKPNNQGFGTDSSFSEDFIGFLLGRAHFQLFYGIRRELSRLRLNVDDFFVLCALGFGIPRSTRDLDGMAAHYDRQVTNDAILRLLERNLIETPAVPESGDLLSLSAAGRQTMIELLAIGKAAEASAFEEFDFSEAQMFKEALRRLIRKSDPGMPKLKSKDG